MIISKTPFRISFFGGGTDYPAWYLKEGGQVLSTSIDKYCYISCRYLPPFFQEKHRVVWSHVEACQAIQEILHPAVREGLKLLGFDDTCGIEIHHQGDLPARAGMGSSSSFAVGLINALTALRGGTMGKHELALKAIELEQDVLKEHVGCQDQVASAHGGFNLIKFNPDESIEVEPLDAPASRMEILNQNLMLFYTGTSRLSSRIASTIIENIGKKSTLLKRMYQMVDEAVSILRQDGNLDDFGALLNETWMRKRELSPQISTNQVDEIYKKAKKAGAIGGKLLGAGNAGFMVFYVPLENHKSVAKALEMNLCVPFLFENQGTSLLYQTPNDASLASQTVNRILAKP